MRKWLEGGKRSDHRIRLTLNAFSLSLSIPSKMEVIEFALYKVINPSAWKSICLWGLRQGKGTSNVHLGILSVNLIT